MSVKILTFHASNNYGAALQAYGLQQSVMAMGYECEFLNYRPQYLIGKVPTPHSPNSLAQRLDFERNKYIFHSFRKKYFIESAICRTENDLRFCSQNADVVIVGSDQVFNPDIIVFENKLDTNFLLSFTDKPKISYAASFGNSTLEYKYNNEFRNCLNTFHAIGIREQSGLNIVRNQLGIRTPAECVIDPTFLYENWEKLLPAGKTGGNGTLLHLFQGSGLKDKINTLSHAGVIPEPLRHFSSILGWLHRDFERLLPGPLTWLNAIRQSDFVVTDSFHCMVFSIIFHRPFIVFPMTAWGADWTERMRSMLKKLDLEDRILGNVTSSDTYTSLNRPINWENVDSLLNQWVNFSKSFLFKAISQAVK